MGVLRDSVQVLAESKFSGDLMKLKWSLSSVAGEVCLKANVLSVDSGGVANDGHEIRLPAESAKKDGVWIEIHNDGQATITVFDDTGLNAIETVPSLGVGRFRLVNGRWRGALNAEVDGYGSVLY